MTNKSTIDDTLDGGEGSGERFITNFPVADLPKYEHAMRVNPGLKLSIRKEATTLGGKPLPDMMAVWAEREQDLTKFWDIIYDRVAPASPP